MGLRREGLDLFGPLRYLSNMSSRVNNLLYPDYAGLFNESISSYFGYLETKHFRSRVTCFSGIVRSTGAAGCQPARLAFSSQPTGAASGKPPADAFYVMQWDIIIGIDWHHLRPVCVAVDVQVIIRTKRTFVFFNPSNHTTP